MTDSCALCNAKLNDTENSLFKKSSRTANNKLQGTFTNYRTTTVDVMAVGMRASNGMCRDIVNKHVAF